MSIVGFVNNSVDNKYCQIMERQMKYLESSYRDRPEYFNFDDYFATLEAFGGFQTLFYKLSYAVDEVKQILNDFFISSQYDFIYITQDKVKYYDRVDDRTPAVEVVVSRYYGDIDISCVKSTRWFLVSTTSEQELGFDYQIVEDKEEQN